MLLNYDQLGSWKWYLTGFVSLVALLLLLPILFIIALSFGSSQWLVFPPPAWTTHWYVELFNDSRWFYSALVSAKIAVIVTILSVIIGLFASFGLTRGQFKGREAIRALFLTPMMLPVVIFGVAIYAFSLKLGLNGTLTGFVIAHLIIALPFTIIPICSALEGFDKSIEDAAILCGANPLEAKFRVTLPGIRHGIFAGAVFSFLMSWDEVVVAIFMVSPDLQTLPVRIWTTLRLELTPVIAAVSSLLVGVTVLLMIIAAIVRKGMKQ